MTGRINLTPEAERQLNEIDESSGEVLGVFHGGQDWEATLNQGQGVPDADGTGTVSGRPVIR